LYYYQKYKYIIINQADVTFSIFICTGALTGNFTGAFGGKADFLAGVIAFIPACTSLLEAFLVTATLLPLFYPESMFG